MRDHQNLSALNALLPLFSHNSSAGRKRNEAPPEAVSLFDCPEAEPQWSAEKRDELQKAEHRSEWST